MAEVEHISVAVREDFVALQTKAGSIPALAELIWNGLDANPTSIHAEFAYDDLAGGMSRIAVYDNGEGFSHERAGSLFGSLGGSWKRMTRQTGVTPRLLQAQEGRGRHKSFAFRLKFAEPEANAPTNLADVALETFHPSAVSSGERISPSLGG